jgi:uncharacterized membrane protein YtjA (UPF0391 family)
MLNWALTLLVIALLSAFYGFGSFAGTAVATAKLVSLTAVGLFVLAAIAQLVRGRP